MTSAWIQGAALVLLAAWIARLSWLDWTTRKLPNRLTVGGAAVVLVARLGYGGVPLFMDGFAAACVAAACLLLPFLARGAGGGDVKMMFAAGAVVGWRGLLPLLLIVSVSGLILALGMLVAGRLDGARMRHLVRSVFDWRYDRKEGRLKLPSKESDAVRVPFSIAIGVGLLAVVGIGMAIRIG